MTWSYHNEVSTLILLLPQADASWCSYTETPEDFWELVSSGSESPYVTDRTTPLIQIEHTRSDPGLWQSAATTFSNSLSKLSCSQSPEQPQLCRQPSTPAQVAHEVEEICKSLDRAEERCYDARKTRETDLSTTHKIFRQWCIDLIHASNHPMASEVVRETPKTKHILRRLWFDIYLSLQLMRERGESIFMFYDVAQESIKTILRASEDRGPCLALLGDLAKYRAELDPETREACLSIASSWYTQAANLHPKMGCYQHYLAAIAEDPLKKLCLYTKASISIQRPLNADRDLSSFFKGYSRDADDPEFLTHFIPHDLRNPIRPTIINTKVLAGLTDFEDEKQGVYILASNFAATFGYGLSPSGHMDAIAIHNAFVTLEAILNRPSLRVIMPSLYVSLVFLYCAAMDWKTMRCIHAKVPWNQLAVALNKLNEEESDDHSEPAFPPPLPEDFFIQGVSWSGKYYRENYSSARMEDDSLWKDPSIVYTRRMRCLWLGKKIAWVSYPPPSFKTCLTN